MMLVEGLMLSDKSAAEHGIGQIFEDVIDSVWAALPTGKKVKLKVPVSDGSMRPAILEWQEAERIVPPEGTPQQQYPRHPSHRQRALRKKSILVDLLAAMRLLYREPQTGRMMEEEDDLDS
jgi:hypothetical protein